MATAETNPINRSYPWTSGLLRELRGDRDLDTFARLIGVTPAQLERWESARGKPDSAVQARLNALAASERFLADLDRSPLFGTAVLVGDIEQASAEFRRSFKEALEERAKRYQD